MSLYAISSLYKNWSSTGLIAYFGWNKNIEDIKAYIEQALAKISFFLNLK